MSNLSIKEMEKLLLASDQEEILKNMTPKSQNVEYLRLMQKVRDGKLPWETLCGEMKSFEANRKFGYQLKSKIEVLRLIKTVENAGDEAQRKKALGELNRKWFSHNFSYPKPATLETGNLGVEIQSGNEEQTLQENKQLRATQEALDRFEDKPCLETFRKLNRRQCLLGLDFAKLGQVDKMDVNFLVEVLNALVNVSWQLTRLTNFRDFVDQLLNLSDEKLPRVSGRLEWLFQHLPLDWLEGYFKQERWQNSDALFQQIAKKKINGNIDNPDKLDLDTLEDVKEFLMSSAPPKFRGAVVFMNLQILSKLAEKEDYQKPLFIEYLNQTPPSVIVADTLRYDDATRETARKNPLAEVPGSGDMFRKHGKVVEKYLRHFFRDSPDTKEWEKYFASKYLTRLFTEVKLLKGERPEGFEDVFSEGQIKEMTNRKCFKLLSENKKNFEADEPVNLRVEMKNVTEVRVKVFQVNVEQALLENSRADFSKMDLLGLVAKEEYVHRFEKEPLESWVETFPFESIQKQSRGVFIVDFLAERMSSRAVITKGRLTLLSEMKKLGTMCIILDEQRRICTGRRTGLYIHGKFYAADESGVIYLPNNDSSLNGEVIVCHENYATISSVEVRAPDLRLSLDVVFNREQLRPGNNVDLILFPTLTLNGEPFSLSNTSNPSVKIELHSEDGITKTFDFDKENNNSIELKEGSFSRVNVTFPPKTTRMSASIRAEVALHAKDKRTLSDSKSFNFVGPSRKQIDQVYLNYDSEKGYIVSTKGRDGEDLSNKSFRLRMTESKLTSTSTSFNLKTGGDGKRVLGKLEHTDRLTVTLSGRHDTEKVRGKDTTYFYSSKLLLNQGDGLALPVADPSACSVMRGTDGERVDSSDNYVLEDLTDNKDHVTFNEGMMILSNLEKGQYFVVVGPNNDQQIRVRVIEGTRFEIQGRRLIYSKNQILQLPKHTQFWRLEEHPEKGVRIVQGEILVNGKPQDKPRTVEAIVMCHNYVCEDSQNLTHVNRPNSNLYSKQYTLSKNENRYFNDKRIGEEILYVLRRRNQEEFMGNTLEKPTLLLKRQKVKDTVQENELLAKERAFGAHMDKCMDSAARMMAKRCATRNRAILHELDLSTDFLTNPGVIIADGLSLDEQNYLQVPQEQADKFNHLYVVFNLGGQVVLTKTLKSESAQPDKQSMVLTESKKEGFVYRNIRSMRPVKGGESHDIESIDKTEYRLVKSLPDLAALMPSLNAGVWGQLKEWSFLSTWTNLSPVEKLKKYDEFISHEMNLFLKFKDAQFFEEVVRPHISNKREKTIVDHFLLGDTGRLSEYLSYGKFQNLDLLQKVLVLMCCRESEAAMKLAGGLVLEMGLSRNKKSEEEFKRVFDKIIETSEKELELPTAEPVREQMVHNFARAPLKSVNRTYAAPPPRMMNRAPQLQMYSNSIQPMQMKQMSYMPAMEAETIELCAAPMDDFAYEEDMYMEEEFRNAGAEVYQGLESTTEYVEKKFFFSNKSLTYNSFYSSLVCHVIQSGSSKGFADPEFVYCVNSPTEMVMLFALLDLPFENVKPAHSLKQFTLTLTPENNCVVFSKQISEVKGENLDLDFLISQRFYDPSDRYYYMDDGTKAEKPVREYKKGKIYGSRVVVTNSTVSGQKVSVITEVPQGAIPVNRADSLRALPQIIDSFCSKIIEFQFYFPRDGEFGIYPSTVAKGDKILATAKSGVVFQVGKKVPNTAMESISDILSGGKIEDILGFLRSKNILDSNVFQFESIGWLLSNEKVWRDVLAVYRERGIFDNRLWSFGLKFGDMDSVRELIQNSPQGHDFQFMNTSLLRVDRWETKDYFPLVNPRAHSVNQDKANILNRQFKDTYKSMLGYLIEKRFYTDLTLDDRLLWITYLLLQDRIQEAAEMFASISSALKTTDPTALIQKDYIEAYLDFMTGYPDFSRSKEICQKYLSYPVLTWRNLFVEIANQLAEYENEDFEADVDETQKKAKTRAQQADESPFVEAEIVEDSVKVSFKNQSRVHFEFYQIDLEVLFSQDPYEDKLNSSLTNVLPFLTETHKLTRSSDFRSESIAIPTNLRTQNLLIRVVDDSRQASMLKYVPFKLNSSLNERYGILKVTHPDSGKPVPKVYVKCFCKDSSGTVKFYKDGYTDLRGSFDFAAVSSNNADNAKSFKILVTSKTFGAKIFSAKPPVSSVKKVGTAKKIRSSNWRSLNQQKASKNLYAQTAALI